MQFNSLTFILFFPIVSISYFLIPHKFRWIWLLISSYFFYMCWNVKYAFLMLLSTFVTYLSGYLIGKAKTVKMKKVWVGFSFGINLGILALFKYMTTLFVPAVNAALNVLNLNFSVPSFDIILPIGISFYTFQALSFTMDVYRGDIKPYPGGGSFTERIRDFGKYALFVSFFPQLVAGPIERSKDLLPQFDEVHYFNYDRVKKGLLLMLWGFFQKVVVADRLALLVNQVFNNYQEYSGFSLVLAVVFFAFQILCDFSAYSDIAVGAAQVMGFRLMKNFNLPFFSKTVSEFWRRWHISMGSWFRDYLYIPLGGSKKGKAVKCRNLMITFLASGLWHGATWPMAVFGLLNGGYQVFSILTKNIRVSFCRILRINKKSFSHRLIQCLFVFSLFCISLIFVRSGDFTQAFYFCKNSFNFNPWIFTDGSLFNMGLSQTDFWLSVALIIFVMIIHLFQRNTKIINNISRQHITLRWSVYMAGILCVLLLGAYGSGYDELQFIYFQF